MVALTNAQIRALKAQAQRLKATLKIGKEVLSTQFLAALNDVLKHHQLVKVKFDDFKERKKELASVVMGAGGLQRRRLLAADFACALGVPLCRSMISWVVSLASCGNRQGGFRDRTGGNGSPRFDTAIRYWLPVFGSFSVLLGSHCESGKVKNTSVGPCDSASVPLGPKPVLWLRLRRLQVQLLLGAPFTRNRSTGQWLTRAAALPVPRTHSSRFRIGTAMVCGELRHWGASQPCRPPQNPINTGASARC